ncbi:MAG: hypothetical protein QW372_06510 [Nitrososphaerales archaeon]
MNPRTLLKILPEISLGEYSINEIAIKAQLGVIVVKEVLEELSKNGIGILINDKVKFEDKDRMFTSILGIKYGLSVEEVSKFLSWKDFESFVSFISSQNGYSVSKRVRWKKHSMEIDVLAIKNDLGLAIDCKHWKRINHSAMNKIVQLQIERARRFMRSNLSSKLNVKFTLPIIVTLYSNDINFINKVPIVPISKFQNFLLEFTGYLNLMKLIR